MASVLRSCEYNQRGVSGKNGIVAIVIKAKTFWNAMGKRQTTSPVSVWTVA